MNEAEALAVLEQACARAGKPRLERFCPWTPLPSQRIFTNLRTKEGLFGGQAGPGKTVALMMCGAQYLHVPHYHAALFRRTFPELEGEEGPIELAHQWFQPIKERLGAEWTDRSHTWTFPCMGEGEATLRFGHMEHEKHKHKEQGKSLTVALWDELTHFTASQYRYVVGSRLRVRAGFPIAPHSRAASNPGGLGHDWVLGHYKIDPKTGKGNDPLRPYIPASLAENIHADVESYREMLSMLDSTEYAQLAEGRWIRDSGGLVYPVRPGNLIDELPEMPREGLLYVLGIDLGSSEREPTTAFVVLAWHLRLPGVFVVYSEARAGFTPSDIAERALELEEQFTHDGFTRTVMDEGALGKGYGGEMRKRWRMPVEPAQKANKLGYRKLLRGALEKLELQIVAPMNEALLREMDTLSWDEDGLDAEEGLADHLTDAALYGWRACTAYHHERPALKLADPVAQWAVDQRAKEVREYEQRSKRKWWMK